MLMKLVREIPSGIEAEKRWGRISETGEGNTQIGVTVNDLNYDVPKFVTQAKASYMLGIAQEELRRISQATGLGRVECAGNEEEMSFTYEELRRICQLAPFALPQVVQAT
jgi:hypothetical protein